MSALIAIGLVAAAAAVPDWWMLPGPLAFDDELINIADRSSVIEVRPGVAQIMTAVVLRTTDGKASYIVGRREYLCDRFEYRDVWIQPMSEDHRPIGPREATKNAIWQDAMAGTVAGATGAMACRAAGDWPSEGFRRVGSVKKARELVDRATAL